MRRQTCLYMFAYIGNICLILAFSFKTSFHSQLVNSKTEYIFKQKYTVLLAWKFWAAGKIINLDYINYHDDVLSPGYKEEENLEIINKQMLRGVK